MKKFLKNTTSSLVGAASSLKDGVVGGATNTAGAAKSASKATVSTVGSIASNAIDLPSQAIAAMGKLGSDTNQAIVDYMFHECETAVYVLHSSEDAEDYDILFDLENILREIKDGYLVKPILKIYIGRADIDREVLARRVTESFMTEMDQHKEQVQDTLDNGKWRNVKDLGDTVESTASGALITAVAFGLITVFTGPILAPIVAPLLLSVGLSTGAGTISDIVSLPGKIAKAGGEVVAQPFQDMNAQRDLSAQEKKLLKAIKGIALVPHNDLVILAGSFDNKVRPMRDKSTDVLPREKFQLPESVMEEVRQVIGDYAPDHLK